MTVAWNACGTRVIFRETLERKEERIWNAVGIIGFVEGLHGTHPEFIGTYRNANQHRAFYSFCGGVARNAFGTHESQKSISSFTEGSHGTHPERMRQGHAPNVTNL